MRQRTPLPTTTAPSQPSRQVGSFKPGLLLDETHHLCPGCGEPLVVRMLLERSRIVAEPTETTR